MFAFAYLSRLGNHLLFLCVAQGQMSHWAVEINRALALKGVFEARVNAALKGRSSTVLANLVAAGADVILGRGNLTEALVLRACLKGALTRP